MITLYKGLKTRNYLVGFQFHNDIKDFLYYADSPLKNYEYEPTMAEKLGIYVVMGNYDSGINIHSNEEPSVLYTSFKIIKPHKWTNIGKVPYYPRYRALNPYQRYEYLQVLVNPYQNGIKTGYLFLLLYCLERRLFEGNEEVIPVMTKLANFHNGKIQDAIKRTLKNYLLWKNGITQPENTKVFNNYTLYAGCYDELIK